MSGSTYASLTNSQVQFWVIAIIFDIVLDTAMIVLSAHTIWTLSESRRQKSLVTLVLLLRSM